MKRLRCLQFSLFKPLSWPQLPDSKGQRLWCWCWTSSKCLCCRSRTDTAGCSRLHPPRAAAFQRNPGHAQSLPATPLPQLQAWYAAGAPLCTHLARELGTTPGWQLLYWTLQPKTKQKQKTWQDRGLWRQGTKIKQLVNRYCQWLWFSSFSSFCCAEFQRRWNRWEERRAPSLGAPGRLLPAAGSERQGAGRRLWARERDGRERSGEQWRGTKKKSAREGKKSLKSAGAGEGKFCPLKVVSPGAVFICAPALGAPCSRGRSQWRGRGGHGSSPRSAPAASSCVASLPPARLLPSWAASSPPCSPPSLPLSLLRGLPPRWGWLGARLPPSASPWRKAWSSLKGGSCVAFASPKWRFQGVFYP